MFGLIFLSFELTLELRFLSFSYSVLNLDGLTEFCLFLLSLLFSLPFAHNEADSASGTAHDERQSNHEGSCRAASTFIFGIFL